MRYIPLTQGKRAMVDDEDYERLSRWKWKWLKNKRGGYAGRTVPQGYVYMHRQIMGAGAGQRVDHQDRDGLNNQRCNLRLCTQSQNLGNSARRSNNRSGFKGVSWDKQIGKWVAHITKDYKTIHLGYFTDKTNAARSYNAAARRYFGEFARLNDV